MNPRHQPTALDDLRDEKRELYQALQVMRTKSGMHDYILLELINWLDSRLSQREGQDVGSDA